MARKTLSAGNFFIGTSLALLLIFGAYLFASQKTIQSALVLGNTTTAGSIGTTSSSSNSQAASIASAAMSYCTKNGGFVSTERRAKIGYYQVCNFEDDMNCELYALHRGDCPIGGVHTIGYDTRAQVYCALVGGKPNGKNNGSCTLPNGTTCTTTQVYQDTCSSD